MKGTFENVKFPHYVALKIRRLGNVTAC